MYQDVSCNPYRTESPISIEEESNLSVSPISEYQFRANVCPILARAINVPEYKCDHISSYDPPESHGLDNCNVIIPSYYVKSYNRSVDIDYFTMMKDDIKNYRPLNKYQLEYIKNMNHKDKDEIISVFNEVVTSLHHCAF